MSDVVQSIRELPGWLKAVLAIGVGFFVVVPVTIVLAAVVGAFVLNLGGSADVAEAPQVQFEANYDETAGELTVRHVAGEPFDSGTVAIEVAGERRAWPGSGTVRAEDSVTISDVQPGDTVRIVWEGSDGTERVLFRYET